MPSPLASPRRATGWLAVLLVLIGGIPVPSTAQSLDSLITTVPTVARPPACIRPKFGPADAGPTHSVLIVPPLENLPRRLRGQSARLRMLVNTSGGVDSAVVIGISDSVYRERVRTTALAYRFQPARRAGCLVADWIEVGFTFPDEE